MSRILIVEDEKKMRHLLSIILERKGHEVEQACDGVEGLERIQERPFDIVITDIKMPRMDGMELLRNITNMDIPCPVVFITAFATLESAIQAMRVGAADYIIKPFDEEQITMAVERTLNLSRVMVENKDLKDILRETTGSIDLVCESEQMGEIIDLAYKVARSDSAVLISGESGTGKEVLARYIHNASFRSNKRFVPVNCAAISPGLVESELFGHEKGSFTGADRRSQGKFEYATAGTLFLDEISELSLQAQAKLLRALQEKKFQRVGGNEEITVDVRMICATNRDLSQLVNEGQFRRDLYFRINVFPLTIPPLRERKADIWPLAHHFLMKMSDKSDMSLTEGAKRLLSEYHWPGNVRELANAMERSAILNRDKKVITSKSLSFLDDSYQVDKEDGTVTLPAGGLSLEDMEMDLVEQALSRTGGNQLAAARLLGLTRAKFRVLLRRLKERENDGSVE